MSQEWGETLKYNIPPLYIEKNRHFNPYQNKQNDAGQTYDPLVDQAHWA